MAGEAPGDCKVQHRTVWLLGRDGREHASEYHCMVEIVLLGRGA